MEKINVAKLLRNCPSGMELDCTMFEGIEFDSIINVDNDCFPIRCRIKNSDGGYNVYYFTKYGYWNNDRNAKCVIFPKGKTSWEGFVPPSQFKDGDVVISSLGHIHILKNPSTSYIFVDFVHNSNGSLCKSLTTCVNVIRLATEEEKEKLFQAIKENGYKWNPEAKTLKELNEPEFKVGDRIKKKDSNGDVVLITDIAGDDYIVETKYGMETVISISNQNNYELVPDKFDINTLVPLESRVLARNNDREKWHPGIWGYYDSDCHDYPYRLIGDISRYCIPYEGNEHLLGTTKDCDEYFKTWEKIGD